MPLLRFESKTIDFATAFPITSREAVAMYRLGGKIYKLLAPAVGQRLHHEWTLAEHNFGLPTPYERIFAAQFQQGAGPARPVYVIQMKAVDISNFFQLSHGGGARLRGWIGQEDDAERLKRIYRALLAGQRAGLMDPQGVYQRHGAEPILYLDIHTRAAENADLGELAAYAEQRWQQLRPPVAGAAFNR